MTLDHYALKKYRTKLYRFLEEGHNFELKKMRNFQGVLHYYELDDTTVDKTTKAHVILDHRCGIISTLIHEFLHWEHPDWSEEKVLDVEKKIMNRLTERQVRNIIKKFADAL